LLANERRAKVARWFREFGMMRHGTLAAIARALGVSISTICRDRKRLIRETNEWERTFDGYLARVQRRWS
jgi:hypothetical protein